MSEAAQTTPEAEPSEARAVSPAEARTRRGLAIGLAVTGLLLVGMVVVLVILAIDAYRQAPGTTPGGAVIGLLRDAAIVLVAFESLVIGTLMIVLVLQIQALVALLRDEIHPLLEALNETVATVRGTARFVSHNVVSPTIQAAGFLAGLRRVVREIAALGRGSKAE